MATRRPNGTGTFRRRADGRWEGRIMVRGTLRAFYGSTRLEVEQRVAAHRTAPMPAGVSSPSPFTGMSPTEAVTRALVVAEAAGFDRARTVRLVLASLVPSRLRRGVFGPCAYCGDPFAGTVDHDIPTARGGPDVPGNVLSACLPCNLEKKDQTADEYRQVRDIEAGLAPFPN